MQSIWAHWSWRIVALFAMVVPLIISRTGYDIFRFPKELVIRAAGIILVAEAALLAILGRTKLRVDRRDPVLLLTCAIVVWTVVTTLTSTHRALSVISLGWVCALVVIFLATYFSATSRSVHSAAILLVPAMINAALVLLQSADAWQPFTFTSVEEAGKRTGMLGNPRDIGVYIVGPAVIAIVLAIVTTGKQSLVYAACSVFLALPVFVTHGLTGLAAYGFGCLALTLVAAPPRWRAIVLAGTATALAAIVIANVPLRERVSTAIQLGRQGKFDVALSHRGTAFLAAAQMGLDHPLTGVGPGCFAFQYYDYKLDVEQKYPQLLQSTTRHLNFGEAHNDHLQTFAVAGIPGYLLLLGAAVMLAAPSLRRKSDAKGEDLQRQEFARLASLPVAVTLLVGATGFFPLELAAVIGTYVVIAGLSLAWRWRS